eukprot:gb/GECH01011426.1/.p1 GENE.gb/GECH01011426.1/~~gb/GECH01011426.1/.p1  ORF type:complete len:484 (+),score=64.83 gb/GECH01011426.1/:1-1452(+)
MYFNRFLFQLIIFLISCSLILSVSNGEEKNRTESINAVSNLLDTIEDRLHASMLEKHIKVNDSIADLHSNLQSAIAEYEEADQSHEDAVAFAATEYDKALSVAEAEHQKNLEIAQEKKKQANQAQSKVERERANYLNGKDQLREELESHKTNVQAELELVSKIRDLLGILHSKNVKELNETCSGEYGCRNGLVCTGNSVCKVAVPGYCPSGTQDCAGGSDGDGNRVVCESSSCRLTIGAECTDSTHCVSTADCVDHSCTPLNHKCSDSRECASGLECVDHSTCKASLRGYQCTDDVDCAPGLTCFEGQCFKSLNEECDGDIECVDTLVCDSGQCKVPRNSECSQTSSCAGDAQCVSSECRVADWLIGQWEGHNVYGVKKCSSGDYDCQAREACQQATGSECQWQEYNCAGYPNENGSYYPIRDPQGRSVSTAGGDSLNWAVTSAKFDNGDYGNLCCCECSRDQVNQQWNAGYDWCGSGFWEPF